MLATDGLFANDERGGGGGLSNEEIAAFVTEKAPKFSPDEMAEQLCRTAQKAGSTDDITVVLLKIAQIWGCMTSCWSDPCICAISIGSQACPCNEVSCQIGHARLQGEMISILDFI